jgi:hypothetical protein
MKPFLRDQHMDRQERQVEAQQQEEEDGSGP